MTKLIHFRRFVQLLVLVILILSPLSQIIRTYRQIPYPYQESPLIRNHAIRSVLDDQDLKIKDKLAPVYDDINGGPYTLDFYFLNFTEPYTGAVYTIRNLFHSQYWNWIQIIAVFLPLLMAFFLGRVFCGYVCPWSLITSWNLKLQKALFNRVPSYTASIDETHPIWKKSYFLVVTGIVLLNPLLLQFVLLPAIVQHAWSDYILFGSYTLWSLMLFGFVILELAKPALICRSLCPTGLFLTWAGKFKYYTLNFEFKNRCKKGCDLCNEVCWLGLKPKTKAVDSACDMCARCIQICPTDRLTIRTKKKKSKPAILKILLCLVFFSCNISETKYEFDDFLIDVTLEENSIQQYHQADTINILYSFVANKVTQREGGVITLDLHLNRNMETLKEPIWVLGYQEDSMILAQKLESVNFPISIIDPSVYHFEFDFMRFERYRFILNSPSQTFQDFELDFRYPSRRL